MKKLLMSIFLLIVTASPAFAINPLKLEALVNVQCWGEGISQPRPVMVGLPSLKGDRPNEYHMAFRIQLENSTNFLQIGLIIGRKNSAATLNHSWLNLLDANGSTIYWGPSFSGIFYKNLSIKLKKTSVFHLSGNLIDQDGVTRRYSCELSRVHFIKLK